LKLRRASKEENKFSSLFTPSNYKFMFRHKENSVSQTNQESVVSPQDTSLVVSGKESFKPPENEASLKELIEKNLKWSQIIYEQNRKLNSKLFWMAASSWVKILILIIPLIAAGIFLPPLLKGVWSQYGSLLGVSSNNEQQTKPSNSWDSLIKMLNLDPAKQEQLKALLK
jgi:hypothetical protein